MTPLPLPGGSLELALVVAARFSRRPLALPQCWRESRDGLNQSSRTNSLSARDSRKSALCAHRLARPFRNVLDIFCFLAFPAPFLKLFPTCAPRASCNSAAFELPEDPKSYPVGKKATSSLRSPSLWERVSSLRWDKEVREVQILMMPTSRQGLHASPRGREGGALRCQAAVLPHIIHIT